MEQERMRKGNKLLFKSVKELDKYTVILNFMIPPTRVGRLVGRLSADTLPTPTISSFFTVNIYTALKSPIHSFEFPYDIARSRFNTQTSTRICR